MTNPHHPGQTLRKARQAAGVSLTALANIVDTDKGNLSKMERGLRDIPASLAYKIELALDMEPYALLSETVPTDANLRPATRTIPGLLCRLIPNSGRSTTFRRTGTDSVLLSAVPA